MDPRQLGERLLRQPQGLAAVLDREAEPRPCDERGFERALAAPDAALAINRQVASAWMIRGVALQGLGRTDEAIADFGRALELDPNWVDALLTRGFSRQAKGDLDGAVADLLAASEASQAFAEKCRDTLRAIGTTRGEVSGDPLTACPNPMPGRSGACILVDEHPRPFDTRPIIAIVRRTGPGWMRTMRI